MAINTRKTQSEILQVALRILETQTSITAISPGSVARSLAEIFAKELGNFYDLMDYNISQSLISSATGAALDNIGKLYNVQRNQLTNYGIVDAASGTFYFYLDTPYHSNITIPEKTKIYSNISSYVTNQIRYETVRDITIPAGRRKVFAPIQPANTDVTVAVGPDSLTVHDCPSPPGAVIKCTNPKGIAAKVAFESDDNYRTRIVNQLRVNAGGTLTALRFAALSVSGARDVRIAPSRYGLGTMEMLVISEQGTTNNAIRANLSSTLDMVRPAGVRLYLKDPTLVNMNVGVGLVIKPATAVEQRDLTARVNMAISLYLNSLLPGDKLVYNQLMQRIMYASDIIDDVRITNYATNGAEISRANYQPAYDEQIVPGEIKVSVLA
jgi:uncharacterized phage protein gp47/JayE